MKKNQIGILIATIATLLSLLFIKDGVKIPTGDSMSYYNCGNVIALEKTHSFPYTMLGANGTVVNEKLMPNTVWPPAASFTLAMLQKLGFSSHTAAIVFVLFFVFTTVLLTYIYAYKLTQSKTASGVVSILLAFSWSFFFWVEAGLMAEGLIMTQSLIAVLYLTSLLQQKSNNYIKLFVAGILVGLAYYIKSASPAFLLACGLTVLISYPTWKQRIINSSVFTIGVVATAIPWLLRNLKLGTIGSAGSGPTPNAIVESITNLVRLFVPRHGNYLQSKFVLINLAFVFLLLGIVVFLVIKNKQLKNGLQAIKNKWTSSVDFKFVWVYLVSFLIVMFFAMYIMPLAINIETRYWLELFPFLVSGTVVLLQGFYSKMNTRLNYLVKRILSLIVIIVFVSNLVEILRNKDKHWTTLPLPNKQALLRKDMALALKVVKPIKFVSNLPVEFEITTGLTAANRFDSTDNAIQCYAQYGVDLTKTMDLMVVNKEMPPNYKLVAKIDSISLFMPSKY